MENEAGDQELEGGPNVGEIWGEGSGAAFTDRVMIGDLSVPRMGIGTIAWSAGTHEDINRFEAITKYAIDNGLNFFDTAERYGAKGTDLIPSTLAAMGLPIGNTEYLGGDTETRLAQWVGGRGYVATKFAPVPWLNTAADVVDACRGSCERLGIKSVDLMQIHFPDIKRGRLGPLPTWPNNPTIRQPVLQFNKLGLVEEDLPGNEEALWDGLVEVYLSGSAKNVGVSNYGPKLLRRCHAYLAKRGVPLASNQIHFNLLYRRQGSLATIEACKEVGVQVLAYYPLAMGLLTGRQTQESLRNRTDLRGKQLLRYLERGEAESMLSNTAGKKTPKPSLLRLLETLKEVAASLGKTPAQVSLNWIICKGAIPIPGTSSIQQIEDNIGALGWRLEAHDVAKLDAAADNLPWEFDGITFKRADSKFNNLPWGLD